MEKTPLFEESLAGGSRGEHAPVCDSTPPQAPVVPTARGLPRGGRDYYKMSNGRQKAEHEAHDDEVEVTELGLLDDIREPVGGVVVPGGNYGEERKVQGVVVLRALHENGDCDAGVAQKSDEVYGPQQNGGGERAALVDRTAKLLFLKRKPEIVGLLAPCNNRERGCAMHVHHRPTWLRWTEISLVCRDKYRGSIMLPLLSLPDEIPRIERGRDPESEGGEVTYTDGILASKEVIDFFDDSAYIKNLVQDIVNKKLGLKAADDQAVITDIDMEAIVPIANQIRVLFTVSNLVKVLAAYTAQDQSWKSIVKNAVINTVIPSSVRVGVTFNVSITGTQQLRQLRVKLVALDVISDASGVHTLSKFLTYVINTKILGPEGYPVVSRTADHSSKDNHWLFRTPAAP